MYPYWNSVKCQTLFWSVSVESVIENDVLWKTEASDPLHHKLITSNYSSREETNLDLSCSINNYTFHLLFDAWLGLISKVVWLECMQKLRHTWHIPHSNSPFFFNSPPTENHPLYTSYKISRACFTTYLQWLTDLFLSNTFKNF